MSCRLLKSCPVCGAFETKKSPVHKHYGGHCCLSCKAFFRRVANINKTGEKFHPCPTNGKCQWTDGTKITCRQCRYDKCLKVGMKEELIPSEEERKKFTFPKKKKASALAQNAWNAGLADAILKSFNEATQEMLESKESKAMIALIISSLVSPMVTEESVRNLLIASDYQRALFKIFAYKLEQFQSLDRTAQQMILDRNSGLFSQFIMAHFIHADNGFDQLAWLLGGNTQPLTLAQIKMFQHVSLLKVNIEWSTAQSQYMKKWKKLCLQVHQNFRTPNCLLSIVGFHLLLSTSHWSSSDQARLHNDRTKIAAYQDTSEKLMAFALKGQDSGFNKNHMQQEKLVGLLSKMEIAGARAFHGIQQIFHVAQKQLTFEEGKWIEHKVSTMSKARDHVPATPMFLEATVSSFLRLNPSVQGEVLTLGSQIMGQRLIYMVTSFLGPLSYQDMAILQTSNLSVGCLMCMLKGASQPTPIEQLRFMIGDECQAFQSMLKDAQTIKREELHELVPVEKEHEFEEQNYLSQRLQKFVQSDEVFVLALMLTLLDNLQCDQSSMLQKCTRHILLKKLQEMTHMVAPDELLHNFWLDLLHYHKLSNQMVNPNRE